jgi:3-oxosteroid 1-dehydrogenase
VHGKAVFMAGTPVAQAERTVDVAIIGVGVGGLVAALRAYDLGLTPLVIEKSEYLGGTSAWSGGALWAPDNPVMRGLGVGDSPEEALRYLEAVVGDAGPSTSTARKRAYVEQANPAVAFMQRVGIPFVYADGNCDYYPEAPGGHTKGRTLHADIFDTRELGDLERWFRPQKGGISQKIVLRTLAEAPSMTISTRTPAAAKVAARVVGRTVGAALTGRHLVGMGQAIAARLLHAVQARGIEIWRASAVTDLIIRDGRAIGVEVDRDGGTRVLARRGVLIAAGGYAHDDSLRRKHREASSSEWTAVIEEDTGDLITAAAAHGAATALLDEAIWTPMSIPPDGVAIPHLWERSLPGSIMVDSSGARFCNEATSYMAVGQKMFERNETVPAIPAWLVLDARHRRRYPLGAAPPAVTPRSWITSGYLKRASDLPGLALECGIDPGGLSDTVARFNEFAGQGHDDDFGRGDSHHDRVFSDPKVGPNPCLGSLEKAPFYAVAMYPGDVGTVGGLVTDEHARVLRADGTAIDGLYAVGSSAASAMGRVYPASGCGVGSAAIFGFVAASDMAVRDSPPESTEHRR